MQVISLLFLNPKDLLIGRQEMTKAEKLLGRATVVRVLAQRCVLLPSLLLLNPRAWNVAAKRIRPWCEQYAPIIMRG
jgi:hypothetical protein